MKPEKTPKEEIDRTTPTGLFNYAESYWKAAEVLAKAKIKSTHSNSPVSFLYYHAIELYLKSFLRLHGHTASELASRKFGHHTNKLEARAAKLGLILMDEDSEVLSLMANTDAVIRSRYIQTGFFTIPSPEALDRTCKSLRESIGKALKAKGETIRL